ncbi:hypothetical protein GCM10011349_33130 [Novosphingobium indicum]|uniref:Uncharacterized protein n=1 Tax=Novosphingobium indicum TaxID=462949 RepID=A0ABQ2JSN5_9SPHN|nr:hypothetical protein [Novosphingobium indicum]GGN55935.1 hypothetical protein GCM10011349_33130 [Novosphingobium indicum]
MLVRFALLLLVCSLVVPATAWSAHLAGHEQLSAANQIHTHYGPGALEKSQAPAFADDHDGNDEGTDKGLTHDHAPSLAMGTAVMLPHAPALAAWIEGSDLLFDRSIAQVAHSRPESLLRPPRAL